MIEESIRSQRGTNMLARQLAFRLSPVLLAGVMLVIPVRAKAAVFNFNTTAVGTTVPFSLTNEGVTASFSSPDGAVFFVTTAGFATLTGNVLLDADAQAHMLDIAFSSALTQISLNFALNTSDLLSTFTLAAFLGATPVATVTRVGAIPEGFVTLSTSGAFDNVRLSASAQDFAVDNITTGSIPEPASLVLVGLAFTAAIRRLRRGLE